MAFWMACELRAGKCSDIVDIIHTDPTASCELRAGKCSDIVDVNLLAPSPARQQLRIEKVHSDQGNKKGGA